MTFQVGQQVICVDNGPMEVDTLLGPVWVGEAPNLDEGMVYRIGQIYALEDLGIISFKLVGVPNDTGIVGPLDIPGYWSIRFRPAVSKAAKADMSVKAQAHKTPEKVR